MVTLYHDSETQILRKTFLVDLSTSQLLRHAASWSAAFIRYIGML